MKTWLTAFLVFFTTNAFSSSLIDAKFKLRKQKSSAPIKQELSFFYRDVLAKSMSSRCHWFPSDSEYMQIVSRMCGPAKGTLLAFSRFMTEHDAYRTTTETVIDHGALRFVDFKSDCELF